MAIVEEISSALVILNVNFTIAIATISILIWYYYLSVPRNLPPGPTGLPIVGYLPFVGREPYVSFRDLTTKYGPIISLYLGNRLVIVLNSYDAIKEAFIRKGEIFSGRPPMYSTAQGEDQSYSIPLEDGESWRIHRRFASNLFRDLGVGKLSVEPLIMDEIQHFLIELEKSGGKPNDFSHLLSQSVSNNICIFIFGKRFEYDDPWFIKANHLMLDLATSASSMSILHFFPWLMKLPGIEKLVNQENLRQNTSEFKTYMHQQIRKRNESHVDGQRDNYMNAFIEEQRARKNDKKDFFPDICLEQNTRDLMIAGTDTVSHSLLWCLLCMVGNPEIQNKVQKEIDEIIGKDRTPCWNDRLRTPYTEATILEAQRLATLAPLSIPHRNTEDCELLGYKIPKNTMILSNLWAVHNDKTLWDEPEVFRPERFLTTSGEVCKKEYLIPYSLGKRECLGISLAKMELYLYFTSMLQRFTFESADGSKPSMEIKLGITAAPKYFCVKAVKRDLE